LVKIYADEGISGTSLNHRDGFNEMIADCKAGKIDMIITKSVSRFARNIVDCISMVQKLAALSPPVGIFFETEAIFSLKDESSMALSFQATIAQEESHSKSRCMEQSLRMRLDHGLPLTPDRIGYRKDKISGKLFVCEDEYETVKLAYFMVLLGYTTDEIAEIYTKQGRKTRIGNTVWTRDSIAVMLRSERNCGDVLTRKTFTPSYLDHKAKKNRGERPQSQYLNWHEPIVSRDDYLAVQKLLDNQKYGNRSILPKLKVITGGLLKGYVIINPRWAGFTENDYLAASASVYSVPTSDEEQGKVSSPSSDEYITVSPGEFDMSGFQVTRGEFLNAHNSPTILISYNKIKFSIECLRKFSKTQYIEILIHPTEKKLAIRPTTKDNRNAVKWANVLDNVYTPRDIAAGAFYQTLTSLMGWSQSIKYKIMGVLFKNADEKAYIFSALETEAYVKSYLVESGESEVTPLFSTGKHIKVVPKEWTDKFGFQYYERQHVYCHPSLQSEADWKIRMDGELFETGRALNITPYEELQEFVTQELKKNFNQENTYEQSDDALGD
jgi:DNA invertase Pin-like site-specific DNA recombinase